METPFRIRDGKVDQPGVCYGYGDSNPRVIWHEGNYMVVRKPGVKDWSSLGSTAYYGAEWTLMQIEDAPERQRNNQDHWYRTTAILRETRPGRCWKKTKDQFIAEGKALAAKPLVPCHGAIQIVKNQENDNRCRRCPVCRSRFVRAEDHHYRIV